MRRARRLRRALAFAAGALADARFGDPPTRWHPVALVGLAARGLHRLAPADEPARERYGLAVALALPAAGALLTALAGRSLGGRSSLAALAFDALALDATSALGTLLARAREVEAALTAGDLDRARALCGTHLVSRDTSHLTAAEVAAATIESVAENLSDAVVAPWLAFALGGAPGAVAYRVANTMDALWGYRSEEFRALGYGAARLDDALNLVPARLTAAALTVAAASDTTRAGGLTAFVTWVADARRTESPNAGHPMAAMAGALRLRLSKPGAYTLGRSFREPTPADITRAVDLARSAAALTGAVLFGFLLVTRAR